jgi:hypothetical protein
LRVLQLYNQGFSYRRIAKQVHLSLRDVAKFINLAANRTKSPYSTSIHDEIILEYRVNMLRSEVRDLESRRENLKNEREEYYNVQIQLCAKRSELDSVMRNLEYERFSNEVLKDIFTEGH